MTDTTADIPPTDDASPLQAELPAEPATWWHSPWAALLAAVVCLALIAAGQWLAATRTDDADRYLYAFCGKRLLAGDAMVRDLWDVKPPMHYWLNAAGLYAANGSEVGILVACTLAAALTVLAVYAAARAFARPPAARIAAVLAAFFLSHPFFMGGTNRSETSELLFEVAAVAFVLHGLTRRKAWWFLIGGALAGLAIGAKQPAVALCAAVALVLFGRLAFSKTQRGKSAAQLLLFVVGTAGGVAAWLAPTLQTADAHDVYEAFIGFPRAYAAATGVSMLRPSLLPLRPIRLLLQLPLLLAAAAVLHALLNVRPLRRNRIDTTERNHDAAPVALLTLWWALAVYVVALAPIEQPHYWLTTIPPLLLLAACAIDQALGESAVLPQLQRRMCLCIAVVIACWLAAPAVSDALRWLPTGAGERTARNTPAVEIAEAIIADAAAQDTVLVWGYSPELLYRINRPLPTPFVGTHFFDLPGNEPPAIFDRFMQALRDAPPAYVVTTRPLDGRGENAKSKPAKFESFDEWLAANYTSWKDVGGVQILKRNSEREVRH